MKCNQKLNYQKLRNIHCSKCVTTSPGVQTLHFRSEFFFLSLNQTKLSVYGETCFTAVSAESGKLHSDARSDARSSLSTNTWSASEESTTARNCTRSRYYHGNGFVTCFEAEVVVVLGAELFQQRHEQDTERVLDAEHRAVAPHGGQHHHPPPAALRGLELRRRFLLALGEFTGAVLLLLLRRVRVIQRVRLRGVLSRLGVSLSHAAPVWISTDSLRCV